LIKKKSLKGEKMDYQNLFIQAWNLIWKNKFLIFLGMLVVLGGVGWGGSGSQGYSNWDGNSDLQNPPRFEFDLTSPFQELGLPVFASIGILILIGLAFLVILALWVIGTISQGGLIYGADLASRGLSTNFAESLRAGWNKGWRLIGIGLVPSIPVLFLMIGALISAGFYTDGTVILQEGEVFRTPNIAVFLPVLTITCILVFMTFALSLLRTFANRACMLESWGVFESYRRGLEVLGNNLGSATVLFIIQVSVSIGIGLTLLVPGILVALCCLLWPLLLVIQGIFTAFYSTLWTLSWNQWTSVPEKEFSS
jgi:hypothetical protein